MSVLIHPRTSPRHGFPFEHLPTIKGNKYGGSITRHEAENYGPILDCVYEMADQIATSNGVPYEVAITQVCEDENWRLLPRHAKMILARLSVDNTKQEN